MLKRFNPKSFLTDQTDQDMKVGAAVEGRRLPWKVSDVMTSRVRSVRWNERLGAVAGMMREEDVSLVPVVDEDGYVIGCIKDRDLSARPTLPDVGALTPTEAKDVMTTDVPFVTMEQSLDDALAIMKELHVRRVPVVDGVSHLVGVVSMSDVAVRAVKDHDLQAKLARSA